ncbi:alpha/beta fold hydrolase [Legionella parisiensis]|uniref:2-succinyl-6-hydroxy-2, 4-cyclohexadiene-1-carboxylate synthase n=1 Tax=Legionella parisiensis TaxID=45071 RepID=A0A1E5JX60_9GAMM|nr:alpha/beta hydrolase [Legionella parisiensis]KTD41287.1 hydrolases or acyltransferases (alpha/beta hydrolase superfamily) [Legionella parisiensis]OEH48668.1 2-succinyl-6-hydroxy-2,4-cyclohexadiene-1-carboxylate synthase [Legionella parisiensis]STX76412.1 hydrolases or acyltransferases (alpha/beta hydrolase superfamily) [Legionella parisiensis]
MNRYLWTNLKARLQLIKSTDGANFNWLFLPGGPGIGSESLCTLTKILKLPGTIWHIDLPGDGSNKTPCDEEYFSHWSEALFEAVIALDNVILVAHSTGGMYALATPKLEKKIMGLVLMDSAPDALWLEEFAQYVQTHPIEQVQKLQSEYAKKPNNALLKKMTIASAPYSFTKKGLQKGMSLLETLPFNYKTCEWSGANFDSTYKAKWAPQKIPTLILAGELDLIIPLKFFLNSRKFNKQNILFRSIKGAGHYPWIENPKQIVHVFHDYLQLLLKK